MVDFRYHIVSIVAVFLALAVGIVLGTYTINNAVLSNIRHQVRSLRHDNDNALRQISTLKRQQGQDRAFVAGVDPLIVRDSLAHENVALVVAPGASGGLAKDIKDMLTSAGANVTTTVKLGKGWTDPAQLPLLDDLATRLVEPGVSLPNTSAYERISLVLAEALLRHSSQTPATSGDLTSADTTALAGLKTAKLLSLSPERPPVATSVVLVAPDAPDQPTKDDETAATAVAALARELDVAGGGTVVAGPQSSAQNAGVIAAVRSDGATRKVVSTVDDADTETGRIRVVLALKAELHDTSGQYGIGPGANAPVPSPAPLPSP
ncbi:MAG: copper transporter [Actinomycetes bacterium]